MLHPFLNEKLPEITKMFKEHHVKSAYAFGSVVTDKFNEESDVDFIINMDESLEPLVSGEAILDLYEKLADLLNRDIDIVSEKYVKNPYFKEELDEKKQLIYGQAG
jgi:predicted nucleotidyltransferase